MAYTITTDVAGKIGVKPRRIEVISTDSLDIVILAGYLNPSVNQGFAIYPSDIVDMYYNSSSLEMPNNGIYQQFTVQISNNLVILHPNPAIGSNTVLTNTLCNAEGLAAGGLVTLLPGNFSLQYQITEIKINRGGVNFTGGGGNRLGQVSDTFSVYTVVPANVLTNQVNGRWGASSVPLPASVPCSQLTRAGYPVAFSYSGGTTDYNSGYVIMTVEALVTPVP